MGAQTSLARNRLVELNSFCGLEVRAPTNFWEDLAGVNRSTAKMKYQEFIEKVKLGEDLNARESKEAVFAMMEQAWDSAQTGAFLTELHRKGETAEEIAGFAAAMREKCIRVHLNGIRIMDTCGTGGDKKNSFNISTSAAFVLAGCGIPIVKHGNRAASSASGSADLLHELGISHSMSPEQLSAGAGKNRFRFPLCSRLSSGNKICCYGPKTA